MEADLHPDGDNKDNGVHQVGGELVIHLGTVTRMDGELLETLGRLNGAKSIRSI